VTKAPPAGLGADDDESFVIATLAAGATPTADAALVGIGDDAAVLPPGDGRLVVTTDTMVEGTHWDDRFDPETVGWRLVAVNVSDLAAMGARPAWATLALTLPSPLARGWVTAFARGVHAACARWGLALVGGDTTRGPVRVATLTAGGHARHPVGRDGGRPGDEVWVTGALGRMAEAMLCEAPSPTALTQRDRPTPPVAFGAAIADAGLAHAMMDLSDGLHADLRRLCAASRTGAHIDAARIPGVGPLAWRTAYGEDHELLFTADPRDADAICAVANMHNVPVQRIGALVAPSSPHGGPLRLEGHAASPSWPTALFRHFGPELA
jgi:thiamine-monophosphate kinase